MTNSVSAQLFNSTLVSSAIAGATEIGLLEQISREGKIDIESFCKENGIQKYPFTVLLKSLSSFKILSTDSITASKAINFDDVFDNKGYFTWLVKGYSYTLQNMDLLLKENTLSVSNLKRSGKFIAKAGKDYGANFVDSNFTKTLNQFNTKYIADIGCGSADRLVGIIQKDKSIKAIGIDSNPDAAELAKQNIKRANLETNIEIVCADISTLAFDERFKNIELLFSFFMGHDLFPKENCFAVFNQFKNTFPNAETFLLCDTFRSEGLNENFPIFTLGFELTHSFMGQVIPTQDEWKQLFMDLNWKLEEVISVDIANSAIFNLTMK